MKLGCLSFVQSNGQPLFHLVVQFYERAAVTVTTNLGFGVNLGARRTMNLTTAPAQKDIDLTRSR